MERPSYIIVVYHIAHYLRIIFCITQTFATSCSLPVAKLHHDRYTDNMFSNDFTFSKRILGILLLLIGIGGFVGILLIDILDVGREGGIGPSQRIGLGVMLALALFGASLIPLGNHPA
jgi:hypothetical protein